MASSSDEGEIIENDAKDMKATSLPRAVAEGSGVDRQDRPRSRYSSPDYDTASRYSGSSRRSRSPRGYKRSRDDRAYYGGGRDYDPRPHRASYDDRRRDKFQRSTVSYDDLDRPTSRDSYYSYDGRDRDRDRYRERRDRDRYPDKRPRNRSRSPNRSRRPEKGSLSRFVREGRPDGRHDETNGGLRYDDDRISQERVSASAKTPVGEAAHTPKDDTKPKKGRSHDDQSSENTASRVEPSKEPEPEPDYEEPAPMDEEAEIERRRKRREEILAKSSSATPLLLHAVGAADKSRATSPSSMKPVAPQGSQMEVDTPRTPQTPRSGRNPEAHMNNVLANLSDMASPRSPGSNDEPSPGGMDLLNDKNLMNTHGNVQGDDEDGPSAADYDPTFDMKEDERRDELRHGQVVLHGEPHVAETAEKQSEGTSHEEKSQKAPGEGDDDDDDFDMFAEDFDEEKYATKPAPASAPVEAGEQDVDGQAKGGILEGDDKDGYYKMRIGEVLNGRYQVQVTLGRGMFSGVVRAVDITTKKLVAIKIMRNNDALRKGGYTEIAILQKLNDADPDSRKHIVKFERSFDYRGHLCMAFENLSLNLREVLRKFGNNVGINLAATRTYAYQIFVSLAHMRKCSIVHADLKPDNILVNESRNVLKICDLGTAIDRSDAATAHTGITPYLVSRFYRAPEIILGMPYDYGVDMWSIGCTLYELYTGKILFTGDSNNQMLKAIMEIRGRLTPKLYKRGQLSAQHFDDAGQFLSVERDKALGKTSVKTMPIVKPTRDLRARLMAASSGMDDAEARDLHQFVDLLDHCLALNPDKRIKPADALRHPFFTSRGGAPSRR